MLGTPKHFPCSIQRIKVKQTDKQTFRHAQDEMAIKIWRIHVFKRELHNANLKFIQTRAAKCYKTCRPGKIGDKMPRPG